MWATLRPDSLAVLHDEKCKRSLSRYFNVFQGRKHAKFKISKKLPADFDELDATEELWKIHDKVAEEYVKLERQIDDGQMSLDELPTPDKSYLDLKIEIARRIMENCRLCTRRCGASRLAGELGYCKCGAQITVSTFFEHMGEEPELVPSGTIFTCGCSMRCLHCQNWSISQSYEPGEIYTPKSLARVVDQLRKSGCRNANLVGGEPTPWLEQWLETFKHVSLNVPVVWNSNSYYSEETARLLAGFVDVYLLDFKYGPADCASRISDSPNYWEACTRNHLTAKKHGELIIRVLVLPRHNECCTRPILEWIAKNLGLEVRVNLMDQFRPEWRSYEIPELRRRLTAQEFSEAVLIAKEVGLVNVIT
jgi:putative pyruvate formate lyase activating enzyme